ncbi:MAG: hypothetical protein ACSHYC_17560 [Alphaproteobacteria bacterium]
MRIEICADDIPMDIDGIPGLTSKKIRIDMPNSLTPDQVEKIKFDSQLLGDMFTNKSDSVNTALQLIANKDNKAASALLKDIGMTEEAFAQQGGGLALAIAVGIGLLLYSQSAY